MTRLPGRIVSQQTCPVCKAKGQYEEVSHGKISFLACQCGQYMPTQVDILLWWQGKTRRISHDQKGQRFESYQAAQLALGVIRDQIREGNFYPELWVVKSKNQLLWENWMAAYLDREGRRCTSAYHDKKRQMAVHMEWFNGINVRELRTAHIQDFAASEGLHSLSPKYRADILSELKHILAEAVEREDLARMPKVPSVTVPKKRIKWLAPELQDAAFEKIPEEHKPIFSFMFTYGPRPAEACALMWDCIDRNNPLAPEGVFYLARTFSRRELTNTPKTKADNELPITEQFAAYLDLVPRGMPDMPVFVNMKANPSRNPKRFYNPDFLRAIWAKASREAGLPEINLYNATKHSRGMQAINLEGWSLETVARLFGHADLKHTQKYAATGTKMLSDLLNKKVRPLRKKKSE